MQFKLFDSLGGAGQIGSTIADVPVTVNQGVFSVKLDFGANALSGANRWLEIAVRHNSGESYTTLSPREQIASSPFSVRTLSAASADNALNLGGVAANQYLQTTGSGSGLTNLNAGNVATGTLSNARLGQIPTANIADSAVTSAKIAGGQVVKSVNTLKDDVTLSAGTNITITPAGNTLTIASTSGGVGGDGTFNRIPFWSTPTTLGNSQITQSPAGVQLPNGVQLAATTSGNNVAFGSPNGETGMTIAGAAGRADVRFDGTTLKLFAGPAGAAPSNGIAINSTTVQLPNGVSLAATASGNNVSFGSPNSETGMSISGASGRADLRFDGTLKLVNGPGGIPPATNGIAISTSGNVGVGTTSPPTRLAVSGGPFWTSNQWTASLSMGNASALGWEANASGQRFGVGQSTGGLYFFRTTSAFGNIGTPSNIDMLITDTGNITQPITANGLVKAMMYVNTDATIIRCYNGITNSSAGTCGFGVIYDGFDFVITFNFPVNNRFVSVTPQKSVGVSIAAGFQFISSNQIKVRTFITDVDQNDSRTPHPFIIIVY